MSVITATRSALRSAYAYSDGDGGGSFGTELGNCRRDGPRAVRCLLLSFVHSYAFDGPELGRRSNFQTPAAWVVATLLNDGVHTARQWLPGGEGGAQPCLRVSVKRHQRPRAVVAVRMRTSCSGRVRVTARLHWRTGTLVHRARIVTHVRTMSAGATWRVVLRLPRQAAAAVRARRHLSGVIAVDATLTTPYGPIPESHDIPIFIADTR